jgi:hypothetical protein
MTKDEKKLCVEYIEPVIQDSRDVATRQVEDYIEKQNEVKEKK